MPVELFSLFFLIVLGSGWFAGQRQAKMDKSRCNLDAAYYKGLNYLLNEQTDKAIDVFIKMLEVGNETVDTHIAFGNLYRQRGEVDEAIKIHQNVIHNEQIEEQKRQQAVYELATDFMRAGLFDRAENLFLELIEQQAYVKKALKQLLSLYQKEKEWEKAIEISLRMLSFPDQGIREKVAHYYCELAELKYQNKQVDSALLLLKNALQYDEKCARASLIQGNILQQIKQYEKAIIAFKAIEKQNPDFLYETLEPLCQCYRQLGRTEEMVEYLRFIVAKCDGITPTLLYAKWLQQEKGKRVAANFIAEYLRKRPSLRGLDRLIELSMEMVSETERENLLLLKELTSKLLDKKPIYVCKCCGFKGKVLHWECPGCQSWGSVRPVQGIEGE